MKKEVLKLDLNKKTIATLSKDEMNDSKGGFLSLWSCKSRDATSPKGCPDAPEHDMPDPGE